MIRTYAERFMTVMITVAVCFYVVTGHIWFMPAGDGAKDNEGEDDDR